MTTYIFISVWHSYVDYLRIKQTKNGYNIFEFELNVWVAKKAYAEMCATCTRKQVLSLSPLYGNSIT